LATFWKFGGGGGGNIVTIKNFVGHHQLDGSLGGMWTFPFFLKNKISIFLFLFIKGIFFMDKIFLQTGLNLFYKNDM
jgi:hypothetical protein